MILFTHAFVVVILVFRFEHVQAYEVRASSVLQILEPILMKFIIFVEVSLQAKLFVLSKIFDSGLRPTISALLFSKTLQYFVNNFIIIYDSVIN